MAAGASIGLAVGLALFVAGAVAVVALCRMALRQGAEVEGEIKALSLRLRFRARPQGGSVSQGDAKSRASNAHQTSDEVSEDAK